METSRHGPVPRAEYGGDDGFTLIELMVVILIVGVLIAVALPTYLGARTRAADTAAQSDLRSGLAVAMTHYADQGSFTGFTVTMARSLEPTIDWLPPGAPTPGSIAIHAASGSELLLVILSSSGSYWCVAQVAGSPVTQRGGGIAFSDVDTIAECTGGW